MRDCAERVEEVDALEGLRYVERELDYIGREAEEGSLPESRRRDVVEQLLEFRALLVGMADELGVAV
jgi:hypothetical protein